jgi:hypothetical protein
VQVRSSTIRLVMKECNCDHTLSLTLLFKTVGFNISATSYYLKGVLTLEPFAIPNHSFHLFTYLFPFSIPTIHPIHSRFLFPTIRSIYLLTYSQPFIPFIYLFIRSPKFFPLYRSKFLVTKRKHENRRFFCVFLAFFGPNLVQNRLKMMRIRPSKYNHQFLPKFSCFVEEKNVFSCFL